MDAVRSQTRALADQWDPEEDPAAKDTMDPMEFPDLMLTVYLGWC